MATARDENQEEEEETKRDDQDRVQTHGHSPHGYGHSGSFRILGGFRTTGSGAPDEAGSGSPDVDESENDPMAWADLEAFGGAKKTLQRPKPLQLSPEDVRQQLDELHVLDKHMADATKEKKSRRGMTDTIAWLKKHSQEHRAEVEQKRRHRSSSFVRAVLGLFHPSAPMNNEKEADQGTVIEEDEHFQVLTPPWGQEALGCEWTELGFALLNIPIVEDVARVRHVIECKELHSASSQAVIALAKWLQRFDRHVTHTITFKEYLLDERAVIADVGCKVTTVYDQYKESLAIALKMIHGDRQDLSDAILKMFVDLEDVLKDEVAAVQAVVAQTMTEEDEYVAISNLFHHLSDEETGGILVAMLLGWMKNHLESTDVDAFLALFDEDVKDKIAGEWMRHYATYLDLLEEFSINFESSMAFFT